MSKLTLEEAKTSANDTGSPDYQIVALTQRITQLTEHLQTNKKDHSCRRGLLVLVARRKKLLRYLKTESPERFEKVVQGLGLRSK